MCPPAQHSEVRDRTRRQVLGALATGTGLSLLGTTGLAGAPAVESRAGQESGTVEQAWVETDTDTDNTGRPGRVHVELLIGSCRNLFSPTRPRYG